MYRYVQRRRFDCRNPSVSAERYDAVFDYPTGYRFPMGGRSPSGDSQKVREAVRQAQTAQHQPTAFRADSDTSGVARLPSEGRITAISWRESYRIRRQDADLKRHKSDIDLACIAC